MRVNSLAWGSHVLSSAGRDRTILQRDVRAPDHYSAKLQGHRSEVCGLKVRGVWERALTNVSSSCLI